MNSTNSTNSTNSPQPTILLTVDVEDWFQVENLRPWFPPKTWNLQQTRVEQNTSNLLDLLDSIKLSNPTNPTNPTNSTNPKATFFILGWIAERFPGLVREIQNRGHEVASHGYNHLMCNHLDTRDLQQDLVQSKKTIEDIIGAEVRGYRAPNFSISDSALELIRSCGYRYDSSYNDFSKHGRYGTLTAKRENKTDSVISIGDDFNEIPISNLTMGKQIIPWGGGGYFRFLPPSVFKAGIRRILRKSKTYMFYMHPWEIDPGQPRIQEAKGLAGWRHYLNLNKTQARLSNLIATFRHCKFPTCTQYLTGYR